MVIGQVIRARREVRVLETEMLTATTGGRRGFDGTPLHGLHA